jgi:hypothetical protein
MRRREVTTREISKEILGRQIPDEMNMIINL